MKQKIYILGLISAMIVFSGAIFKINHYPGAAIMLITGIASLVLIFLPFALANHYRADGKEKSLLLHIVTYITCFVVFTAMLFKLMHWPYAGAILMFALPFPYVVFLPVFILVTSKDRNFNIYNTAFVLLLLALNSVISGLLSLNVTSESVEDSYQLSRNYINQQKGLSLLSGNDSGSALLIKIDEVIKIVNNCQDKVLELDDKTIGEWRQNPGNLARPDIRGSAATGLGKEGERSAMKLRNELDGLFGLMAKTPGYETLVKNGPEILDFKFSPSENENWYEQVFNDFLAWVLIYLDGLEANLDMIKVSTAATKN
jgi:hypothetical protein